MKQIANGDIESRIDNPDSLSYFIYDWIFSFSKKEYDIFSRFILNKHNVSIRESDDHEYINISIIYSILRIPSLFLDERVYNIIKLIVPNSTCFEFMKDMFIKTRSLNLVSLRLKDQDKEYCIAESMIMYYKMLFSYYDAHVLYTNRDNIIKNNSLISVTSDIDSVVVSYSEGDDLSFKVKLPLIFSFASINDIIQTIPSKNELISLKTNVCYALFNDPNPFNCRTKFQAIYSSYIDILPEDSNPSNLELEVINDFSGSKDIEHEESSRFSGAAWFKECQRHTISVYGAGGIGSNVIFQLSRISPNTINVYDRDSVELANLSGQFYGDDNIGEQKVSAISNVVNNMSHYNNVNQFNVDLIDHNTYSIDPLSDVHILALDSIGIRKTVIYRFGSRYAKNDRDFLFIDGRLSMDVLQVVAFEWNDIDARNIYFNKLLFDERDREAVLCSMKQTTFMANMIASVICNIYINWCSNKISPFIQKIPFFTEYDSKTMTFTKYDKGHFENIQ